MPTIHIAGDHAAFQLKAKITKYLEKLGYTVKDFGPFKLDPEDDYPDFVIPMARAVARNKKSLGIAICGTGIGICIAANKVRGIRAAAVYDLFTARCSREHNNANIICLGARARFARNFTNVKKILRVWLNTPFSKNPKYARRIKKVKQKI